MRATWARVWRGVLRTPGAYASFVAALGQFYATITPADDMT
jgi:hypothetical protein